MELQEIMETTGLKIRHQNPPEDITENIAKFIIRNYENDCCLWCKSIDKNGDLYSSKYTHPIEVKAFTSNGPLQFGPNKKFDVLYFLDLRKCMNEDKIVLWKVNLSNDCLDMKCVKISKRQTYDDQCKEKRRPHISWDKLYPQITKHCIQIYENTFENIFIPQGK